MPSTGPTTGRWLVCLLLGSALAAAADAPVPSLHIAGATAGGVTLGRDTLTTELSVAESAYLDTSLEGRVGLTFAGGFGVGALPAVAYAQEQQSNGVSTSSLTFLFGVYAVYYLPVAGELVPFVRIDNAIRWNQTTAESPASGPQASTNTGYYGALDLGVAWFLAPHVAISAAIRGSILTRDFVAATRLNAELGAVVGFELFLPR